MASTRSRVPSHTNERVNRQIRNEAEESLVYYAQHRNQIDKRLRHLDKE